MTPQNLNDFFTPEQVRAFAAMWAKDQKAAEAQAREMLELLAEPAGPKDEIAAWASRLLFGVLGEKPELGAWLQAVAVGSFLLRPEQKYALPEVKGRPARFISRGLSTLDEGVSSAQRSIGITDESVRDGLMLVGWFSLVKELRNLAAARVAIGTAWPLVAGVDKHLNNAEHRLLHRFGDDERLQRLMADAASSVLQAYMAERFPDGAPKGTRAALHERELPTGVDLYAHFTRVEAAVHQYRERLFAALDVHPPEVPEGIDAWGNEDAAHLLEHLTKATAKFTYRLTSDGSRLTDLSYDAASLQRIREMLPLLMRGGAYDELRGAATRAFYRHIFGSRLEGQYDKDLHAEVREWVSRGYTPPPELRPEHAYLFEEEAALLFFNGEARHLQAWRELGFFPDPRPTDRQDFFPALERWMQVWHQKPAPEE